MKTHVLDPIPNPSLRTYVVWLPVTSRMDVDELEKLARHGAARISDPRVTHFLDPEGKLGERYAGIVRLPRNEDLAWDIYFVFGPEARWEEKPPTPHYWMHQLARPSENFLDAKTLGSVIGELVAAAGKKTKPGASR